MQLENTKLYDTQLSSMKVVVYGSYTGNKALNQ
jgi:hypothetical protein